MTRDAIELVIIAEDSDLSKANHLMVEALTLLDKHHHIASAYLDHAIVTLGLRPHGEGYPPGTSQSLKDRFDPDSPER